MDLVHTLCALSSPWQDRSRGEAIYLSVISLQLACLYSSQCGAERLDQAAAGSSNP